jgi:hypothetical protein
MRENKRKKISNKPTCPTCGAVITVRCEAWHNRLGRCLRHSHHTGPHYFAAKSIQDDPTFWEALQDPWTVVYFPKPGELGRDPQDAGELERDAGEQLERDAGELERDAGAPGKSDRFCTPGELLITLKLSRCEKILEEALGELADGIARELVWIKRDRDVAGPVSRTTSSASDDLEAGAPEKKERQNS